MDNGSLIAAAKIRTELIKFRAYKKWKFNAARCYHINYKMPKFIDLVKMIANESSKKAFFFSEVDRIRFMLMAMFSSDTSFQWSNTEEGYRFWSNIYGEISYRLTRA